LKHGFSFIGLMSCPSPSPANSVRALNDDLDTAYSDSVLIFPVPVI